MKLSEEQFEALYDLVQSKVDYVTFTNSNNADHLARAFKTAKKLFTEQQDDVNRFAPNVETNSDVRIVPRRLLEHCLGCLQQHFYTNKRCTDVELEFAISQLKATLAIEKADLHAARNTENVFLNRKSLVENLKKWPQDFKMNTVTLPADILNSTIKALEDECPADGKHASYCPVTLMGRGECDCGADIAP